MFERNPMSVQPGPQHNVKRELFLLSLIVVLGLLTGAAMVIPGLLS